MDYGWSKKYSSEKLFSFESILNDRLRTLIISITIEIEY